jgi:hypothetical protein
MRGHGQVLRGGKLELVGIDVVNSTGSSAVFTEGQVTVTNCNFAHCVTGMNDVARTFEASIPSGGAALRALGGAIQARGNEATMWSTGSSFVSNAAKGAKYANYAGAIYAAATVRIDTTRFDSNYVQGGTEKAAGGALFLEVDRFELTDSEFISNKAIESSEANGGAIRVKDCGDSSLINEPKPDFCTLKSKECGYQVRAVTFRSNSAIGGSSRCKGGAIFMGNKGLCVNVTGSVFEANSAEDSGGNTEGGAFQVADKAILKVASTRFVGNTAKGASDQARSYPPPVPVHCALFEAERSHVVVHVPGAER